MAYHFAKGHGSSGTITTAAAAAAVGEESRVSRAAADEPGKTKTNKKYPKKSVKEGQGGVSWVEGVSQ